LKVPTNNAPVPVATPSSWLSRGVCLILLDLVMPHMDGFEFLSQLVERPDSGDFPVLVLSAHNQIAEAEGHPGVLGTLQKPFDVDELLRIVSEHC
jgi:CheY-like chemotaxis protein